MCNIEALSLLVQKLWPRLSFFESRSKVEVKVMKSKILVPKERSFHKEYTCEIWKPYLLVKKLWPRLSFFSKVGQNSRSRSQSQKFWCWQKGLVTRNTHVKFESPIPYGSKVMTKVKFFSKIGQKSRSRSRSPKFWYNRKVFPEGTHTCNMKALSILVQKL